MFPNSKLERRVDKYMTRINRLKHRQHLLKEQKRNLLHEAEVVSCSLDGMQSLLNELDPATFAQLQSVLDLNSERDTGIKIC